ncbi:MAG: hypothetical protein WAX89_07960 [Alphaproteobacteria bacterium]
MRTFTLIAAAAAVAFSFVGGASAADLGGYTTRGGSIKDTPQVYTPPAPRYAEPASAPRHLPFGFTVTAGYSYWGIEGSKLSPDGLSGPELMAKLSFGNRFFATASHAWLGGEPEAFGAYTSEWDVSHTAIGLGWQDRFGDSPLMWHVRADYGWLGGDMVSKTSGCSPCGGGSTSKTEVDGTAYGIYTGINYEMPKMPITVGLEAGYRVGDAEVGGKTVDLDGFVGSARVGFKF